MKENYRIRFWKVIFTYLIAFYHLNSSYKINTGWYIAVEFFFMVSGYFICQNFSMSEQESGNYPKGTSAWQFTLRRYRHFWPYICFSFFCAFILKIITKKLSFSESALLLFKHIPELLLFHDFGFGFSSSFYFNSVAWYISVLLIVGYLIWWMLGRHKKFFIELLIPFSVLFIYAYLYRTYGYIGEHRKTEGFLLNSGLLRGLSDMFVGVLIFEIANRTELVNRFRDKRVIGAISDGLFLFVIIFSFFYRKGIYDYIYIMLLSVGIALSFPAGSSENNVLFNNSVIRFFSDISLAVYLNHKVFRSQFVKLFPDPSMTSYVVYFLCITLFSVLSSFVVKQICRKQRKQSMRR